MRKVHVHEGCLVDRFDGDDVLSAVVIRQKGKAAALRVWARMDVWIGHLSQ